MSHKKIQGDNTSRPLDLLHMDLMCPMRTKSKAGKKNVLVVDHFSRYSFVSFLRDQLEIINHLTTLFTRIQIKKGHPIIKIRSDRGREFDNVDIDNFPRFPHP